MGKWADALEVGFNHQNQEEEQYNNNPVESAPQVSAPEAPSANEAVNYNQPVSDDLQGAVYDAYYSPSWFLEEQTNRENPEYVSPVMPTRRKHKRHSIR